MYIILVIEVCTLQIIIIIIVYHHVRLAKCLLLLSRFTSLALEGKHRRQIKPVRVFTCSQGKPRNKEEPRITNTAG